jgi:hypothetical protein
MKTAVTYIRSLDNGSVVQTMIEVSSNHYVNVQAALAYGLVSRAMAKAAGALA